MENGSILSSAITNLSREASDSNSNSHQFHSKHASKFKGVVRQQNGHWGAQIYANDNPIWLGSFESETEAAMAYDSAAIKLRNGDTHRNFAWTEITIHEPKFQSQLSLVEILNMIKNGSYPMKFSNFLISQMQGISRFVSLQGSSATGLRQLFQKELTPSDVSKLNRLVIPKKYAVKYFPPISETVEQNGGTVDDVELEFFDRSMVLWKFRYCYWKSSQSFVFTRGWNRFAKEKGLRAKDRVVFSAYESGDRFSEARSIIDVAYNNDGAVVAAVLRGNIDDDRENGSGEMDAAEDEKDYEETKENVGNFSVGAERRKSVRLFGVEIFG